MINEMTGRISSHGGKSVRWQRPLDQGCSQIRGDKKGHKGKCQGLGSWVEEPRPEDQDHRNRDSVTGPRAEGPGTTTYDLGPQTEARGTASLSSCRVRYAGWPVRSGKGQYLARGFN